MSRASMSESPSKNIPRGAFLSVLIVLGMSVAAAATWVEPKGEADECAAPRYVTLEPTEVLSAGEAMEQGARFAIRFTDVLAASSGGDGATFRTRCGVVCQVSDAGGAPGVSAGEPITVEGELRGGSGHVQVQRILPGPDRRSRIERELVLRPPGSVPRLVDRPGEFTFSGVDDDESDLTVKVEVKPLRELRRQAAGRGSEGGDAGSGAECSSSAAYQWAKHGMRRDAAFAARVREVRPVRGPWASFEASGGGVRQCRRALVVESGLWCLIPAGRQVADGLRGPLFPGRRVRIVGSTLGLRDGRAVMVVRRLRPPEFAGSGFKGWKVTIRLGEKEARQLYRPGSYVLRLSEERIFRATLREKRRVGEGE